MNWSAHSRASFDPSKSTLTTTWAPLCVLPHDTSLCRRPRIREHKAGTYSVTSIGGVGSTFLLEWLKSLHRGYQRETDCSIGAPNPTSVQCRICLPLATPGALPRHLVSCHIDDDGVFKHLADPAALNNLGSQHRAVYIVGSPVRAVASVFRRRFQCWHYHRLHGCWFTRRQREGRIQCNSPALTRFRARYGEAAAECRVPAIGPLSNLDAYAASGADLFGAVEQFTKWLSCRAPRCTFDILVIRYETLNASLPALFDFLELPTRVRDLFPFRRLRKPRSANGAAPAGLGLDSHVKLLGVYGALEAAMERIPAEGLRLRNSP